MNRGLSLIFVAASLIVLAGCRISVEPFEPPNAITVTADPSDINPTVLDSGTLSPGETIYYFVEVSSSVASNSEVVAYDVDIGRNTSQTDPNTFSLRLYTSGGGTAASSVSWHGFASGAQALSVELSDLSSGPRLQSVSSPWFCYGPCIVSTAVADRYISIRNDSSFARDYDLYAFGSPLADTGEPDNDFSSGIPLGAGDSGAIETLGDEDHYSISFTGTVAFSSSAASELGLRAYVSGGGPAEEFVPGENIPVFPGDVIRVYSSTGWAGSPVASTYSLTTQ